MRRALCLLLVILVGCTAPAEPPAADEEAAPPPPPTAQALDTPDGARVLAELKDLVDRAPQRFDNLADHETARNYLEGLWLDAGLNVTRDAFTGPGQTGDGIEGQNLVATIPGRSNTTIIIGAHYDSAVSAHGAAYDDGTGTMLVVELARVLAGRTWNHTIVAVLFDQEEAGLVGSTYMAQALHERGTPVALMINLDMVGINWPAQLGGVDPIPLDFYTGGSHEEERVALWKEAVAQAGYPDEASTQRTGLGGGSSDHGPFRSADFEAAWLRGALIGSYPNYHNLDRVEGMTLVVGGDEADLVAGFQTVLDTTLRFLALYDRPA